ncbi:Radical SAM domain protein [Thermosinus carboxydivorans Nor1]|uniref:Mycofactocin maturase MftC n=1 Tax=Thermosinus carboxydivorans Nor1 TaxID=401526 RepID=A1HQU0_9FIRM|nr:radical SAM protein [Thermosinus carboxydivorans]EAX47650.1 Radical SAM domain protein [Thermosinus carboxydivorans Nor1]
MIGCTKLLCGTATVSDIVKYGRRSHNLPPQMLQFSSDATPIVVWNMTNRCNLSCQHCYISAEDREYAGELTTEEAKAFIDDLAAMKVPVLLFSGGEPLVRPDLFELGAYARDRGIRPVISTNGTLITPAIAERIRATGFQYVGVSLDGNEEVHDRFRGRKGAFAETIAGIRNSLAAGNKTGIRFTVNKLNYHTLPEVLDLVEREKIPRFCLYHLVYAGRGRGMADLDISAKQKRQLIEFLIEKTQDFHRRGVETEILTTDNHADGIYILQYFERHQPERVDEVRQLLEMHGGCSAGQKMANVDPRGYVHACQFWGHKSLGNVREKPFSQIWQNTQDEFLLKLRDKSSHVEGRCGECRYKRLCGGCRIRAEAATGNLWGEDPACYLTDWKE